MAAFRGRPAGFVAIPQRKEYHELLDLIATSLKDNNIEILLSPNHFTPDLLDSCKKADFLIADVTEPNLSTYYVIGASQASRKPVLLLCRESSSVPPEISGFKVLQYKPGNVKRLSQFLRYWLPDLLLEQTYSKPLTDKV